jgi:hypothetical protein
MMKDRQRARGRRRLGCRKEEAVGPRHLQPAAASPEDGEFVPKHNDFQFLEIVRLKAQGNKL